MSSFLQALQPTAVVLYAAGWRALRAGGIPLAPPTQFHFRWSSPAAVVRLRDSTPAPPRRWCACRFGPCTGVTRLQRWERAYRLGLEPPAEVPELVRRHGEGSDFNRDLFAPGKL